MMADDALRALASDAGRELRLLFDSTSDTLLSNEYRYIFI